MRPTDLAGLVVDGFDHALAPNAIIRARPPVKSIGRLGKVDAVAGMGIDDKQSGLGVEAGGTEVGKTLLVGCNPAPIGRRFLCGVWDAVARPYDSKPPGDRYEKAG